MPLPVLVERLAGDWEEVETGKGYWFGYTDDMYSMAAHGNQAVEPLLSFARKTPSAHAKYGAILTLHLIGIDRRVTGRFSEEFKNPRARAALLDCLADDSLRDEAMRMLIRDPWPSDVPRLMEAMRKSQADCWTIVNGLFRYGLAGIPFHEPVPASLAKKPVTFKRPRYFYTDEFFWEILRKMERVGGEALVLEDGLLQSKLWGYEGSGYGGGNAGLKKVGFGELLTDIVEWDDTFSFCQLGNRIQYFVEDGKVHICSSRTAKERWLKWWDNQSAEYKRKFGISPGSGAANRSPSIPGKAR